MDKANPNAFKELKRVIKFVIDSKDKGLKIEPKKPERELWDIVCYCDSDYAGDKASRKSVSGFILFFMGVPILWRLKAQVSVSLSSSEAEYVSLSEAAKEVKFVYMILTSLGLKVKTPIVVRVDNVGAIFNSENISTTSRSKHVDIRYRFVNEFLKTEDNLSDGFTKNISGDIYENHINSYLTEPSNLEGH